MRGVSIPAWTFLREPSASSGAPSEDEPLGHSSQEAVDELDHDLHPLQYASSSRRMAPPPVPGPSSVRNHGGRRPSGNHDTQSSSSAPRRPTSPSRTRRPHSGTDEEEERPKKKKRDLHNAGRDDLQRVHLSVSQRENATRQRHSLSNAAASGSGQHRRATFAGSVLSKNGRPDAGSRNHQKQERNGGPSSSLGKHSTPLSQAQARAARPSTQSASARGPVAGLSRAGRKSPVSGRAGPGTSGSATQPVLSQRRKSAFLPDEVIDLTEDPPEVPAISQPSRPSSTPATPLPREVIEILDSDEERPPPPPPVSETLKKIKAEPRISASSGRMLPRRNKEPPKCVSPSCVIVLDSSDDDGPPARISVPQRDSQLTQHKESCPEQRNAPSPAPSSPLMECKPSPPASPPLWSQAQRPDDSMLLSPPLPPERRASPIVWPPLEDVDMAGDATVAFDADEVSAPVDFVMEEGKSPSMLGEVLRPSPETVQKSVSATSSPVDVPASFDEELPEAGGTGDSEHAIASQPESGHLAAASLSAESFLLDGASTLDTSPHEVNTHSTSQTSLSGSTIQPPPVLSTASSSTAVASLRAETASPVSRVLDPGLQGLVITESTPESSNLAMSASDFDSPSGTTMSTSSSPGAASRKRSLKPTDRSPWKMHGAAHGGPTGWFNHNRLSQKRRSRSQSGLQSRPSKSPVPHSPLVSSASSSTILTTVRASPREPLQEPPKAATPAADTPDVSKEGVSVEANASLSSRPMQSQQDSDENMFDVPVLQAVNFNAAPRVQSDVLQRATQPSKVHAVSEEGQAPSEARVTEMRKSNDTDGRSVTPPADNPPPGPLGPTLSQIIRNAQNENARRNVIDLTFDKSDDDRDVVSPGGLSDKPETPLREDGTPLASSVSVLTLVARKIAVSLTPSTPSTVRTIDFSSIRKDRKVHLRTPQLLQSSPVAAPIKTPVKATVPPLPRNIRRASAPDALKSPPLVPEAQSSVTVSRTAMQEFGSSGASVYGSESPAAPTATPAAPTPLKPALPRRPQAMRSIQPTQSPALGNSDALRMSAAPPASDSIPEDRMIVDNSGPSTTARVPPSSLKIPSSNVESPPHSESPHTDATEEEECRSLIYPSTTPEESPEVEIPDEDEFPVRSLAGRRIRSQASSEASSGPRRSARLSSSSASSSVEPEELSRPRLRRRERVTIRTHSDEEVTSYGGISRFRTRYSRAFEAAGFESLSWKKDRQRVAKEFAPVTQSADNIPHDLHDRLNALPPSARHASNLQAIFEAEIAANTAEDEPNAPPIRVINDIDDEPTPPMEFYYSNLMWHSADVPKPDFNALKGCGCVGACNPNSKTCACVRRQREHSDGQFNFLYDQKGRLKLHDYPIFECNINCGCSDDCPNRVIQHGRRYEIAIRKTTSKGWGIFAGPKKIPSMSFLGVYAGEYLTDEEAERRGLRYNSFGRTYLFDLDFYHIKKNNDDSSKYTVDAYHAGNFTRYLNHSCDPNCAIVPGYINESNTEKPLLTMFTIRDVEPYEELCFDYNGSDDEKVDPDKDGAVYVQCQCGAARCKGYVWK